MHIVVSGEVGFVGSDTSLYAWVAVVIVCQLKLSFRITIDLDLMFYIFSCQHLTKAFSKSKQTKLPFTDHAIRCSTVTTSVPLDLMSFRVVLEANM